MLPALALLLMTPTVPAQAEELQRLLEQSDALSALPQHKADAAALSLKLTQLEAINAARESHGLGHLALDLLASRVADLQASQAAEHGYHGHWDMQGRKPYIRYTEYGGVDHLAENAYSEEGRFSGLSPDSSPCAPDDPQRVLAAMGRGLQAFLDEGPGGGHHDNVLDPLHTHVGLGFACVNSTEAGVTNWAVKYYEEFLDRGMAFSDFPRQVRVGQRAIIKGRVLEKDTGVYAVSVYRDPFPQPMSAAQLRSAPGSYPDYGDERLQTLWPWDLHFDKDSQELLLPFRGDKPGLYYLKFHLKRGVDAIPYRGYGKVSTAGLPVGAGLVIRVTD